MTNSSGALIVVACALIDADGRVLMAQRPVGKPRAGLWEFPGGKVNPNEAPQAALRRELYEELRVETEESCLAPLAFSTEPQDGGTLYLLLYVCRKWRGNPIGAEGQELKWLSAQNIMQMDMPAPDRPLAAQLRDFLL